MERSRNLEEGRSSSCWRVREFSEEEWFSRRTGILEEVWKEAQEEGSGSGRCDTIHSGLGVGVGSMQPAPPSLPLSYRHTSAGRPVLNKASCTGVELYPLLSLEEWVVQVGTRRALLTT